MKATAKKPTRSRSRSRSPVGGFFGATHSAGFFSPVMRKAGAGSGVPNHFSVSQPSDPLEKQAERTADQVMRAPERADRATSPNPVQRFGIGAPTATADAKADIQHAATGGQPLPRDVSTFMQNRLGADFSDVRVHADENAASLSNHLSARAFTYQNHVFFSRGQYQPGTTEGRHLLAHELTHTIQQGSTSTPTVQRLGVQDALDYFADKANYIPGYRMLTLIIGFNPISLRRTDRTAANFLRALIELVPGGALITRALDTHGVINQASDWVGAKVAELGDIGGEIKSGLDRFIDSLSWTDIFDLGDVWDRAKRIFTDPIGHLISFGTGVVSELLGLVKQAILRPLAALAQGTRGYDLLKAVLAQDPITGDPYPRTPDTLIGGFMKLIGQEEVWENLKRGKAVQRAWAWFQGALAGLMAFVLSIPGRILTTLRSLTFADVVTVVGAFAKIGRAFLDVAGRLGSWALQQVLTLLEILVSVVAPRAMPYIAKAKSTFQTIVKNPVAFVGNLVRAGKLGFQKFAANILQHLKNALITWLVGPLAEAGVYVPTSFTLLEIVKLVLSVLGLTWSNIRSKLVKIIPEPVLVALEKTAAVLVTLVTQGPAAAWDQIVAELTELKDQLIGQVTQMIQTEVVKAAVTKLVTMLNPAGAVIQAILAIWNTVSFFIEKASQIGAVVASFVDSVSAIAAGQVESAAKKVEQTMASTLVVVIGFLAKFAGLGGIPAKLVGIVTRIRGPIDKGLDKIVTWLGALLSKLVGKAKDAVKKLLEWWRKKVPISGGDEPHTLTFQGEKNAATLVVQSSPTEPVAFMEQMAEKRKVKPGDRTAPVATTRTHAAAIGVQQNILKEFDKDESGAVSDKKREKANTAAAALDLAMGALGSHFSVTFKTWGVMDPPVKGVNITRGSFLVEHKRAIAAEARANKQGKYLRENKDDEKINVQPGIARRHVVSAYDMRQHYKDVLETRTVSEAKLLLEQRGSHSQARVKLKELTVPGVIAAAIERYTNFFGFAKNIFLGNSQENSEIQENLDKGNEKLAGDKLWDHVDRIKRNWALDDSFKPSEKD